MSQPGRWVTQREAAEMIGVAYETFRHSKAGTKVIPRIKIGRKRMVARLEIDAFMARKEREARQRTRAQTGGRREKERG